MFLDTYEAVVKSMERRERYLEISEEGSGTEEEVHHRKRFRVDNTIKAENDEMDFNGSFIQTKNLQKYEIIQDNTAEDEASYYEDIETENTSIQNNIKVQQCLF